MVEEGKYVKESVIHHKMFVMRMSLMLSKDGIRFEAFLNGTNRKAGKAIKRAEEESRRRQEKSNEIKRLTQNTETLVTDLTKLR
jgi:iron-sulfur cluster repair protein YtfE (RIC family)